MAGNGWGGGRPKTDPWPRFLAKVKYEDRCVLWTAARHTSKRYGVFVPSDHRMMLAHRYAYEYLVGSIPEGWDLHHNCPNTLCVLPWHLEPVEPFAHRRYSKIRRKPLTTHCAGGHEYTEESFYVNSRGARVCKICTREYMRKRRAKERGGPPVHYNTLKTHCPHGHEYTSENTLVSSGSRFCRACLRTANRAYYWRKKKEQSDG